MIKSVTEFYDRLSPVFRHSQGYDWEAGVRWEGEWLNRFLANQLGGREPWSVLDCSCGIGTQAIGLALHGHQVHATDLKSSVSRLRPPRVYRVRRRHDFRCR